MIYFSVDQLPQMAGQAVPKNSTGEEALSAGVHPYCLAVGGM
jgi:hypothetical protein